MCIAINKPENKLIPHVYLEESWKNNDDGAGFMYAEDGKLHIKKGFMHFHEFMRAYEPHEEKPCVVHFRIATHGATDQTNTHPFQVADDLGFVHNGIISKVDCRDDKQKSDTFHFNEKILKPLYKKDKGFIRNPVIGELIQSYIGMSKLVFLTKKGDSIIVNAAAGKEEDGIWYSNTSYKPRPAPPPYTPPTYNQHTQLTPVPNFTFKMGTIVYVKHPRLKGRGTIEYFTGNTMVGVRMDGDKEISLVPMSCISVWIDRYKNSFKVNDYVTYKTIQDDRIGIVKGTSKDVAWVQWLDDYLNPMGTPQKIMASLLDYWDFPLGL